MKDCWNKKTRVLWDELKRRSSEKEYEETAYLWGSRESREQKEAEGTGQVFYRPLTNKKLHYGCYTKFLDRT